MRGLNQLTEIGADIPIVISISFFLSFFLSLSLFLFVIGLVTIVILLHLHAPFQLFVSADSSSSFPFIIGFRREPIVFIINAAAISSPSTRFYPLPPASTPTFPPGGF